MNNWTLVITLLFLFLTFTPSERVALVAAFLVLMGVAGEYVIEIPALEKRKSLATRIKHLSMALLLLGLAGDVLGIVMSQAEMAALTQEAGDAVTSAKNAHDEADAVKDEAAEIDADLARTQYLLSGRSVIDRDTLVKKLKQYRGQIIRFSSYNSEPDESLLCGDLAAAARSAEVNVGPQTACGLLVSQGNPSTGIAISGPNVQQTLDLAQILVQTVDVGPGGVVSGIKAPELSIMVGAKPPFRIGQARGVKAPAATLPMNKKTAKP